MKNVLISTLAATAFIASGVALADDVDGASFESLNNVEQSTFVSSTFDGFNASSDTEVVIEEN